MIQLALLAALSAGCALHFAGIVSLSDAFNGTLETLGAVFILMSIRMLHTAKLVRGVSAKHVAFFSIWGIWNLYYYPSLGQWFSFWGGVLLVVTNIFWLGQIAYYLIWEGAKSVIGNND
jgi:hypothetical protein